MHALAGNGKNAPRSAPRCRATAAGGKRCRKWARSGTGFCYQHQPGRSDPATKSGDEALALTRQQCHEGIARVINSLLAGSIDSARGRALIDAYKFQLKHLPEQEAEDAGEGKLTDEELEAALDEQLQAVRMRIRSKREADSAEA